jgi:hypothetical protein
LRLARNISLQMAVGPPSTWRVIQLPTPWIGKNMKKILLAILAALTVVSLSGCFPVFIPVGGGHHHDRDDYHYGDRGYHRGW